MLHEDYFIRMLRPFSLMVAQLLNLKKSGQYDEALAVIERTGQKLIGFDPVLLNSLSVQSLMELLAADSRVGAAKCLIAADLFQEQGDVYEAQNDDQTSSQLYLKALDLYIRILLYGPVSEIPDHVTQVHNVDDKLQGYALPSEVRYNLFHYYAKAGAYAYAKDSLFELLDLDVTDDKLFDDGIAFYEMLQHQDDAALEHGNLPRDEVQAGLQELIALRGART